MPNPYYAFELHQAVDPTSDEGMKEQHMIEKKLATKKVGGRTMHFVKWLGYPNKSVAKYILKHFTLKFNV